MQYIEAKSICMVRKQTERGCRGCIYEGNEMCYEVWSKPAIPSGRKPLFELSTKELAELESARSDII